MRSSFCSCLFEFGSRSHHKRTAPGFVLKRAETTSSRRSRYACLVLFLCAPECDCCILTCPNEPHQEGKRTLVRFNRTKWGRCESTLKISLFMLQNRRYFPLFINGNFFPLTLLNISSFISNSYFVSINSVSIIRNCRIITIQMKLVLTKSIFSRKQKLHLKWY